MSVCTLRYELELRRAGHATLQRTRFASRKIRGSKNTENDEKRRKTPLNMGKAKCAATNTIPTSSIK